MQRNITVFGSSVVDLMSRAPHLPAPAETVKGSFFMQSPGGKGFNQAIAARKAGVDVAMITKLGRDSLSEIPLRAMREAGLSEEYLFFSDSVPTGTALIMVDETTGQNAIVIVPGACSTITDADVAGASEQICNSEFLLLQLEINQDANEKAAELAKEHGVKVIVNTAPYQPVSDDFLRGVYLVTPNEVEAEELTGVAVTDKERADRAAELLFAKGVRNVLITLGSRGVYLNEGGKSEIIPAYRVRAVDTTGAGDAFNGGLVAALAEGKTLREAAQFANALAALSVQRLGTTASMPSRAEIDSFLSQTADLTGQK
ncbi:MAG: ribokinase [Oscillospiraceae bacterium]|nr:ribokinase [Oscillospiraceae bacterium]